MTTLERQLTAQSLRALAGNTIYARGEGYFQDGTVLSLSNRNGKLRATVAGTDNYRVTLWPGQNGLNYQCDCPMGEDGACCKHVVAAGLAWLADRDDAGSDDQDEMDDDTVIRNYLLKQNKATLSGWLLAQCDHDEALYHDLKSRALRNMPSLEIKPLKQTIRDMLQVRGFADYRRMRDIVRKADAVVSLIEELLHDGHTAIAAELAEYAVQRGFRAYANMDDSGGSFGDIMQSLAALHLQSCRDAGEGYPLRGKTLFKLKRLDEWGLFAFADYAPLLSERELNTYRKLATAEWAKVPARGPADRDNRFTSVDHFDIAEIMKELALHDNDLDAWIAVESRDLTSPYRFLEIAERLKTADRSDEALEWAERGQAAFPARQDLRLVEFLCAEYQQRGRQADAVQLARDHFQNQPRLDAYKYLKNVAETSGDWPAERRQALQSLNTPNQPGRQILLVDIHLWENDPAAALDAVRVGGCNPHQWLKLARACEQDHPQDAADIYRRRLDDIVNRKNNDAYDQGADIVNIVRKLMRRTRQDKEFREWLDEVRTRHKAKRNFMQRLDTVLERKETANER